jgi:hypothetical protein
MSHEVLERRFARMGARLRVVDGPRLGVPSIDIKFDRKGELFELRFPGSGPAVDVEVVDIWPGDRHLLLLVRDGAEKSKFVCGHDERHWFVAAVPEGERGVSGVGAALRALRPEAIRAAAEVHRTSPLSRRNVVYLRQGEWFFVPVHELFPPDVEVLRDEPLSRGRGKAHLMEYAYRRGGEPVYVSRKHPAGLTRAQLDALPERERPAQSWQQLVRDAEVFAKGAIRHPDHATIVLRDWHRVLMNTEQQAKAMRHVVFLD